MMTETMILQIRKLRNQDGVTLPEVLITVTIFTLLMGVAFRILLSSSDNWQVNKTRTELQQNLRIGSDWIKEDLRQSGASSTGITYPLLTGPTFAEIPTSYIKFQKATGAVGEVTQWSSEIKYSLSNSQLVRRFNGVDRVIAQDFSTISFTRATATPNLVTVSMTVSRIDKKGVTISLTYSFNVNLRNS